jgi:hypothetical protein
VPAITLAVHGAPELSAALKLAGARAVPVMTTALYEEMALVLVDSKAIVPVGKTGALLNSATILPPEVEGTVVKVTVGYGGAASKYALIVHNMPSIKHPTKPGTRSHYLSDPMAAHVRGMESRLAERIASILE